MSALGYCQKPSGGTGTPTPCQGPLCVSGAVIRCERCGTPAPDDHPMMKEWEEARKIPVKVAREVSPIDYPATVPDRVLILEREVAELKQQLSSLLKRRNKE